MAPDRNSNGPHSDPVRPGTTSFRLTPEARKAVTRVYAALLEARRAAWPFDRTWLHGKKDLDPPHVMLGVPNRGIACVGTRIARDDDPKLLRLPVVDIGTTETEVAEGVPIDVGVGHAPAGATGNAAPGVAGGGYAPAGALGGTSVPGGVIGGSPPGPEFMLIQEIPSSGSFPVSTPREDHAAFASPPTPPESAQAGGQVTGTPYKAVVILERASEQAIVGTRLSDDRGPYFESYMGNQQVEVGYRPRGMASKSDLDFAWRNTGEVKKYQTAYQTPEAKALGWRQYVIEMIKIFKCIQGATDQAAFDVVDELTRRNAPPEDVMSTWAIERSAARVRGSSLINEKGPHGIASHPGRRQCGDRRTPAQTRPAAYSRVRTDFGFHILCQEIQGIHDE